jgi:hypothetical protein
VKKIYKVKVDGPDSQLSFTLCFYITLMPRSSTAFPYIYINALPKAIYNKSVSVLFADDTSILFTHSYRTGLKNYQHSVFETINNWFNDSLLCLNFAFIL